VWWRPHAGGWPTRWGKRRCLSKRQMNYADACSAYEKAAALLQAQDEPVPIELWNNGVYAPQALHIRQYACACACVAVVENVFKIGSNALGALLRRHRPTNAAPRPTRTSSAPPFFFSNLIYLLQPVTSK
jgi:hypothetical protein